MLLKEIERSRAYMVEIKHIPTNDINQVLNKFISKLILQSFTTLVTIKTAKQLIHHNNEFALHSGFNATEKKKTIAR